MKRLLSFLLCILLTAALFSCASASGPSGTDDAVSEPDPSVPDAEDTSSFDTTIYYEPDELPDHLDFGGEKFTILAVSDSNFKYDILTDELNSDPVNDSVFNREKYVEDRLGLDIDQVRTPYSNYNEKVAKQHASGDNDYQLFAESTVWFVDCVFDGYLTDLYEVDYLDFSKPWWSDLFIDEAEIEGHLFLVTGSLSLSTHRFIYTIFYNKKLADDYSASFPDLADLYGIVDRGEWTIDRLKSLSESIYEDLNGDSERDENDLYGLCMLGDHGPDAVWSSFDLNILGKDDDGWFSPDVNQDKIFKAFDIMVEIYHKTKGTVNPYAFETAERMFAGGTLLFTEGTLRSAESAALRNMQDEYGLVPFPKFDENQKEYYSGAHDQYVSFSIPQTNPDPDTAGAVLEAMASYAYRNTVPQYLDIMLKGRYMSDAHSRRMVDLIVKGFRIDAGWIYSRLTGLFPQEFRTAVCINSNNFASTYAKTFRMMKITVNDLKNRYFNTWN